MKKRLPDPGRMIERIKLKLNPYCAVRKSIYCELIIAMRMQGIPYRDVEDWLVKQGMEHRIAAPTICNNFKHTGITVSLTKAEELVEQYGGILNIDTVRELSLQIYTQRGRIDRLVRQEEARQKKEDRVYHDKRIRAEIDTLTSLVKTLHAITREPLEDIMKKVRERQESNIKITDDAFGIDSDLHGLSSRISTIRLIPGISICLCCHLYRPEEVCL